MIEGRSLLLRPGFNKVNFFGIISTANSTHRVDIKKIYKAVPLQAWSGPEGSRNLRFPDYMTTAQDGGKVQPYAPAAFTPRKYSWYSFLLEAESTPGP
jgi:hypothetical protein